jgi:hypothetical protein
MSLICVLFRIIDELHLKAPYYIELEHINDFGRLVCALERTPLPTFSVELNKEHVLAVQSDFINERPVLFFVKKAFDVSAQYLAYRITGGSEEIRMVDLGVNPTYVYSPIIHVDKFPLFMTRKARVGRKRGYIGIRLKDLSSLAKVAAYKTIYDEPPLPLILFKDRYQNDDKIVIGAAMNLNESDTISYFYYIFINEQPRSPFLRYSSQRVEQPSFSNRIDEHGYIYLKVITLSGDHPLVRIYV